jgi:hypothetical protein
MALPLLDAARGTILILDFRASRELAFYERYVRALDTRSRDHLLNVTAASWVPLEWLREHYRALDSLNLDDATIDRVGRAVGDGAHGAFLQTLIRLAGQLGFTPWAALQQAYKLWVRSWRGGGIAVHKLSEHAAHMTVLKTPIARSRFFRVSFGGAVATAIAPFCSSSVVEEVPAMRTETSFTLHVRWAG